MHGKPGSRFQSHTVRRWIFLVVLIGSPLFSLKIRQWVPFVVSQGILKIITPGSLSWSPSKKAKLPPEGPATLTLCTARRELNDA